MGDGVLAYFDYPRAERAVRAGLALVEAVAAPGRPPARAGVPGVDTAAEMRLQVQGRRGREIGQLPGGKNTSARTSMLSRGGAPGASGLSNAVWKESLARPSVALSCTLISTTSSGCISEKYYQRCAGL